MAIMNGLQERKFEEREKLDREKRILMGFRERKK